MSTITDVAKVSGVSIATVSNVLNNGSKPVRAETRVRVLNAARSLNYHPNAMAQGLVRRRMNTLGIFFGVVDSPVIVTNPYASAILQGVLTAAADTGNNLTFFTARWRGAEQSAPAFRDRRADGLLLIAAPTDSDILAGLSSLGLTLVTISTPSEQYGIPSVDVDNVLGARMAVEHLLSLGHRKIAHLSGDLNMLSVPLRKESFIQSMLKAGICTPKEYMQACHFDGSSSYEATRILMSLPDPPTAIFASNDAIAITAMEAARDMGISIPNDLSIIGFDDIVTARMTIPSLTTIHQPFLEVGEKAARLLVERIQCPDASQSSILIPPFFVERDSTGPVKGK